MVTSDINSLKLTAYYKMVKYFLLQIIYSGFAVLGNHDGVSKNKVRGLVKNL